MFEFYKRILFALVALLAFSGIMAFECFYLSNDHLVLLPATSSNIPWRAVVSSDTDDGGLSTYSVKDTSTNIDYSYFLADSAVEYPYVSFALRFVEQENNVLKHVDLSSYAKVSFNAKCNPENILSFSIYSFDEKISSLGNLLTYRIPTQYFSCNSNWKLIELDLSKLETPEWWLTRHANLASRDYSLEKTASITFGNTVQSPVKTESNVAINNLVLEGRNWFKVITGIVLLSVAWITLIAWVARGYAKISMLNLQVSPQPNIPFVAYQKLSMESHKDKERKALLSYMVTEYRNPNLDMDSVIQKLGMNRTKINDLLKEEVGLTFNAYLNKLRLAEAARLLCDNSNMSIAEVAYSLGYNNVSYFNRLFKNEYGCAPKAFKSSIVNKGPTIS